MSVIRAIFMAEDNLNSLRAIYVVKKCEPRKCLSAPV